MFGGPRPAAHSIECSHPAGPLSHALLRCPFGSARAPYRAQLFPSLQAHPGDQWCHYRNQPDGFAHDGVRQGIQEPSSRDQQQSTKKHGAPMKNAGDVVLAYGADFWMVACGSYEADFTIAPGTFHGICEKDVQPPGAKHTAGRGTLLNPSPGSSGHAPMARSSPHHRGGQPRPVPPRKGLLKHRIARPVAVRKRQPRGGGGGDPGRLLSI